MPEVYDVIIIGSGPAGLTAGIYTVRARLRTLILERETLGGQVTNIELVENYPGFGDGIAGSTLSQNMVSHAMKAGVEFELAEVEDIRSERSGYHTLKTALKDYYCKALIIASGTRPKKLGIPGEEEFTGRGVGYCAVCEGGPYVDKIVAVAGGGDSGLTEALYMTRIASKVIIIEMLPYLTATETLQERARANPKIEIRCNTRIEAILGNREVESLELFDVSAGRKDELRVNGLFMRVGLEPNNGFFKTFLPLDDQGYILVNGRLETGVSGIFAAGDIRSSSRKQIVSAAGDGAVAALAVTELFSTGLKTEP